MGINVRNNSACPRQLTVKPRQTDIGGHRRHVHVTACCVDSVDASVTELSRDES